MGITTVQGAFEEYEKKVRVPPEQTDRAKEVHPQVREAVEAALGEQFNRAFLAGSYARKVQTAPQLKDVDIIFVLNDTDGALAASALTALECLREAAKTCDLVVSPTRIGVRAVKLPIDGEEFTVDAVAALEDGFGGVKLARYLPDEGKDDWTTGTPRGRWMRTGRRTRRPVGCTSRLSASPRAGTSATSGRARTCSLHTWSSPFSSTR